MNKHRGDFTVGDVDVPIIGVADEVLTGKNIDFIFIKPTGETLKRDADSVSGYNATYHTVAGDLDEDGEWSVYLYYATAPYYYTRESGNTFWVRQKPEDMAVA